MSQNRISSRHKSAQGTPRWVMVFVILALILGLLFGILLLFSPGLHGPSRHMLAGDASALYGLALFI